MEQTFFGNALRKGKQYGESFARGVPQMATGFVDLLGLPLTMSGVSKPEDIFGSTDYFTKKGLLPPKQDGLDNETTELLSSALSPAGAAKAGITGLASLAALGIKSASKLPTAVAATELTGRKLSSALRKTGLPIANGDVAEKLWSEGKNIYAFHEMDGKHIKVANREMLNNYAPDLLMHLPDANPAPAVAASSGFRTVEAPKEVTVGKRFLSGDNKGDYRGTEAFGGINPTKLGKMRSEYLRKMEEGAGGRMWYDESSDYINKLVGGDNLEADRMANALAITSSRTPVASNLMYANKAWNQNLVGEKVHSGGFPSVMGGAMTKAFNDPNAAATGLKRSPFSAGLSVNWMGPEFANRPTHDIHDVRAWGIKDPKTGEDWSKGVGEAGHRFLDEQGEFVTKAANERALGGATDWTPYRSQAAAWIAQKAAREGVPIGETARHYGSYAPDYQALLTREWGTFPGSEHIPESVSASNNLKRAFADDMERVVTGSEGIDNVARGMGALTDSTIPNVGFFEGMSNPGFTSRINVGKAGGSQDIDPASAKVADAIAAYHGLVGAQKQSAWNYASGTKSSLKNAGGFKFQTPDGQPMSPEAMTALREKIIAAGGDVPMVDPAGARSLIFNEPGPETQKISKALRALAKNEGLEGMPLTVSKNIFPSIDEFGTPPAKWSAQPFIDKIEAGGPKMVANADAVSKEIAPQLLATAQKHAQANGWTQAKWYEPMMKALANGGIAELKDLVKKGIVPVLALSAFGAMSGEEETQPQI